MAISWKSYYKRIPSSIVIGKNTYEVLWINEFKDEKQLGESRFAEHKQIVNQPIKEAVHTYFHEVVHAISFEYDADLTEKQVLAIEKSLTVILKNGNLFRKDNKNDKANKRKRRSIKRVR